MSIISHRRPSTDDAPAVRVLPGHDADPRALGLVQTTGRCGGLVTTVYYLTPEVEAKVSECLDRARERYAAASNTLHDLGLRNAYRAAGDGYNRSAAIIVQRQGSIT